MKNLVLILLLFISCNEDKKYPISTILKLKLSNNLPFKEIKLQKFQPLYGSTDTFEYHILKTKDFFQFEIEITEPGFLYLIDENNIGIGYLFLHPAENITAEILFEGGFIKSSIIGSAYPGDNMLYRGIYDSVVQLDKKITSTHKYFSKREYLSQYVDSLFEQTLLPSITLNSNLKTSKVFYENVFKPQLEILKCYLKNKIIEKSKKVKPWKKFYADDIFIKPNYKLWCSEYLEYKYFMEYIYEVVNSSKAVDLRKFIKNIEKKYKNTGDQNLLKIAVSQGLIIFAEKFSANYSDNILSFVLDSICKIYSLDVRKYNFPNFTLAESERIGIELFNKIFAESPTNNIKSNLGKLINDTSKLYYIDYWASWCDPCVRGLPYTLNLYNQNTTKLKVFFFSIDNNKESFLTATKKYKLPVKETFQISSSDSSLHYYKQLNPKNQIPVYQLIFFYQNSWRVMNALSAEDPSLIIQIENLKKSLNKY